VEPKTPTFGGVAGQYLKAVRAGGTCKPAVIRVYQANLRLVQRDWPGLADTPVAEIQAGDCRRWFTRRRRVVSPRQANQELQLLKRVLENARRQGLMAANPAQAVRRIRVKRHIPFIPANVQFARAVILLRGLGTRKVSELLQLLAYSGMTITEATALTWAEVDFARGKFLVTGGAYGTRTRRSRRVPLFPEMRSLLLRILARRGTVNPSARVLRVRDVRSTIHNLARLLGYPAFDAHSLRHLFVINALHRGNPPRTVAAWIGHKDGGRRITRLYEDHARHRIPTCQLPTARPRSLRKGVEAVSKPGGTGLCACGKTRSTGRDARATKPKEVLK
jgi:integrase